MLWPTSKRSNRTLSPALSPRQPQAVLGWKNRQRGAAPMASFDLLQGLVMSLGGFFLQMAPAAQPCLGGHP